MFRGPAKISRPWLGLVFESPGLKNKVWRIKFRDRVDVILMYLMIIVPIGVCRRWR